MALIAWLPLVNLDVVKTALPAVLNVTVPNLLAPSKKVTVPLGLPAPGLTTATVAVKVTDWPTSEEGAELTIVVVAAALLTVSVTVALLGLKFVVRA